MYTFKYLKQNRAAIFRILTAAIIVTSTICTSCIKDDIPYPHIQPNISAIEAEHQNRAAAIDSVERTVTLFLDEQADIQSVKLTKLTLTPGATIPDTASIINGLNLLDSLRLTVTLYYDYIWTITAQQNIERHFTIANQVGKSEINTDDHTVTAMVPTELSLTNITVTSIKLGGETAVMTPDIQGRNIDFTNPVEVTVTEFGRSTKWTISVTQTDIPVQINTIDAWTNVAWIYATAEAGKKTGFQYRLTGVDVWTDVPEDWITRNGGSFSARLINLNPESDYEVRAFSDEDYTVATIFTTMTNVQLPNSNFENWWLDGKIWCPWSQEATPFWGTGNKGATTLGPSNTVPITDHSSQTGYHGARLESKFVGISILGKLAAGNLFTGDYVATEGTNGILSFGREFHSYPTTVTGKLDYTSATISHSSNGFESLIGQPDTCIVWCALGDWDQPYEIRTNPQKRKLFNINDPGVIAYGEFQSGKSTGGYIDFTVTLNYRSTSRKPRYIILVASASKYGDYFTGGNGSVLCIDYLQLNYDY